MKKPNHPSPVADIYGKLWEAAGRPSDNYVAEQTKLPQTTVTRVRNGESKTPVDGTIRKLADFFGVTPAQMRGEDPAFNKGLQSGDASAHMNDVMSVPSAGKLPVIENWGDIVNYLNGEIARQDIKEYEVSPVKTSDQAFALRVENDAMTPDYRTHDLLTVDPTVQPTDGDDIIVRIGDRVLLRRLSITAEGKHLIALNPTWPGGSSALPLAAQILGVVVFAGRRRK